MKYAKTELLVGIFMVLGLLAAVVLALKVAGLVWEGGGQTYTLHAKFDNIGSLKLRAPVRIGGVLIGRVENIRLDPADLVPVVDLAVDSRYRELSSESKIAVQTAGIIGEQYLSITPGFVDEDLGTTYLTDGDYFRDTGSAVVLEDLIAKFAFGGKSDTPAADPAATAP